MNREGKFRNICNCNCVTCGNESWMRPNAGETVENDMTANMDNDRTAIVSEREGFWLDEFVWVAMLRRMILYEVEVFKFFRTSIQMEKISAAMNAKTPPEKKFVRMV